MNAMAELPVGFDARELRQVLGTFVTGVTVVSTIDDQGRPHGLTANSFTSVSLDPPLVLWSQAVKAPSHPVYCDAERFVVNILAEDQLDVSNRFARPSADKFAGLATRPGLGGVPLLEGCAAWIECRKVQSIQGGDHMVFLGQVERIERNDRKPLIFGGGRYLVAQPHDLGPIDAANANIAKLKAIRLAHRSVAELCEELDETIGLGVWGNLGPTIVRWEAARDPVSDNLRTGLVLPVLSSATGLAFGAWLPRALTLPLIETELASSEEPATLDDVFSRLDATRRARIARLVGTDRFADLYGGPITALSVPVFDANGDMVMALTAIGAADRLDADDRAKVPMALTAAADRLSRCLGAPLPPEITAQE
jgi:flavin reductase (DIM6/NTAB) family NADH-FMN oxidoreductase RutF/DNA-binding IclR family transcriptional regulator